MNTEHIQCEACLAHDYITCRDCGCHFITILKHDGRCFDCRGDS